MRTLKLGLLSLALLALPGAAHAGGLLAEVSLGSGLRAGLGDVERIPTNLGVAVGYGFTDMLKLEIGAFANLGDVQASVSDSGADGFNVDLRGMVVVSPPLFPLYLRGIVGLTNLKDNSDLTYGGALGLGFGLFGVGAFVEAGAMQRNYQVTVSPGLTTSEKGWQVEGRVGVSIG
ncbi:MAG: hypothetical protein IPO09_05675 [Anaeromyxobacter sp.]|nr:hypothetical protein [Anaeromyxobacter sp.]